LPSFEEERMGEGGVCEGQGYKDKDKGDAFGEEWRVRKGGVPSNRRHNYEGQEKYRLWRGWKRGLQGEGRLSGEDRGGAGV